MPLTASELRSLRLSRDLSLREAAARSGGAISPQGLSRLEQGVRSPQLDTLMAIASVYEVPIVIVAQSAFMIVA